MFHLRDGLFFERADNGAVRIVKTANGRFPGDDQITFDITVPENEWGSVVAMVSSVGETHESWMSARAFHMGRCV
jgi:hypothetical protein